VEGLARLAGRGYYGLELDAALGRIGVSALSSLSVVRVRSDSVVGKGI
jgi:hypothetical protein